MCVIRVGLQCMASTVTPLILSTTGLRPTSGHGRSASIASTSSWRNSKKSRRNTMAVTTSRTAVVTLPTDTQILITRDFDAPRHLVYKAYTTPELIKRWWSGDRGEGTGLEGDLRGGGS